MVKTYVQCHLHDNLLSCLFISAASARVCPMAMQIYLFCLLFNIIRFRCKSEYIVVHIPIFYKDFLFFFFYYFAIFGNAIIFHVVCISHIKLFLF